MSLIYPNKQPEKVEGVLWILGRHVLAQCYELVGVAPDELVGVLGDVDLFLENFQQRSYGLLHDLIAVLDLVKGHLGRTGSWLCWVTWDLVTTYLA